MEVQSLKLQCLESDLTSLTQKLIPADSPLENVRFSITPEGVCVKGTYPLLVPVSFECWWEVVIEQGKVVANITRLKAFGMPAMIFKSAVMKALESLAAQEKWLTIQGERIVIDPESLLTQHACPVKLNLRGVTCAEGAVILDAGTV